MFVNLLLLSNAFAVQTASNGALSQAIMSPAGEHSFVAPPPISELSCDVIVSGSLCFGDGSHVILPPAIRQGATAYFDFEENVPLDKSGNGNHGRGTIVAAPGVSKGTSGHFQNHAISLDLAKLAGGSSSTLSITFWALRVQSPSNGTSFCPTLKIGNLVDPKDGVFMDVVPSTGKLQFRSMGLVQEEISVINGKLTANRWTHIALVISGNHLKLYINGILDTETGKHSLPNFLTSGTSLVVGNPDPASCQQNLLIDDLWTYSSMLDAALIIAESTSSAEIGYSAGAVHVACFACDSIEGAMSRCEKGYTLCSKKDWTNGVYRLAQGNGYGVDKIVTLDGDELHGLGMCCRKNES